MTENIKYVIKYKLDGERRFDFAVMADNSEEQARLALQKIHGDDVAKVSDIKVSKAL